MLRIDYRGVKAKAEAKNPGRDDFRVRILGEVSWKDRDGRVLIIEVVEGVRLLVIRHLWHAQYVAH